MISLAFGGIFSVAHNANPWDPFARLDRLLRIAASHRRMSVRELAEFREQSRLSLTDSMVRLRAWPPVYRPRPARLAAPPIPRRRALVTRHRSRQVRLYLGGARD